MNWMYASLIPVILVGIGAAALNLSAERDIYSVHKAVNNYEDLNDKPIILQGKIIQSQAVCTQIYCGPENPCCNTCSASVELENGTSVPLMGDKIGCSGNSCSLNCTPSKGENYRFEGQLDKENNRIIFEVKDYREVNPDR